MFISSIAALIVCLFSYYDYLETLTGISKSEIGLNKGYIFYSIQHEDNPLDKDIESFMKLHGSLNKNLEYDYYELYSQYLEMPEQQGQYYEEGTGELLNQCAGVKCIQVNKNLLDDYGIEVTEGFSFENKDFSINNNKTIPVLMGAAYSSLYNVGDIFKAIYLFDEYEFRIIGFLAEGSNINTAFISIEMDDYIIMPSFEIDASVPVTNGLKIHYANKTSGLVRLSEGNNNVFEKHIASLLKNAEVGKYSWTITPMEVQYKEIFKITINQTKTIIALSILLLLFIDLFLVYRFSKYDLKKAPYLSGNGFLCFVVSLVFMIFSYATINYCLIKYLGIMLFKISHLLMIDLSSIALVLLNKILYKYRQRRIIESAL